eukprot:764875-Hanusia_phi.AAC.3
MPLANAATTVSEDSRPENFEIVYYNLPSSFPACYKMLPTVHLHSVHMYTHFNFSSRHDMKSILPSTFVSRLTLLKSSLMHWNY